MRVSKSDLRDGLRTRIRLGLMSTGRHLGVGTLTGLRLALSYLEIGHDLDSIDHGAPIARVDRDTDLFDLALARITGDHPLYLEFGVFEGRSMRWWASHLTAPGARLVGFDSFEGLPDDWHPGIGAGHFATGQPPAIDDPRVSFEVGWFDQTLPGFDVPPHDQLVVNIDCDLYSSATTALTWAEPLLQPGSLIYFDEYPDRDHERRALAELSKRSQREFCPVAFASGGVHWLFEVR